MDSIESFRAKTLDTDPDIRYMAVSDLNTLLDNCAKGGKPLPTFLSQQREQRDLFNALLGLVRGEQEGNIQEQVQMCFNRLCANSTINRTVCKDAISQLMGIIDSQLKASDEISSNRRESASLALREALKGVGATAGSQDFATSFAPQLLKHIQDKSAVNDARVKSCECFNVILQNNGAYISAHPELPKILFGLLIASTVSSLGVFRKRLVACIVTLSSELSDEQFVSFVQTLCENLSAAATDAKIPPEVVCSLVQIVGSVAGTPNGHRISKYLDEIISKFVVLCGEPSGGSMEDSSDFGSENDALDELRSLIFQSCEILLGKCSGASVVHLVKPVLNLANKFVSYDPNYFGGGDDDDDDDDEMTDGPSGGHAKGGDDDDDGMSDGDEFGDDDFGSDFGDDDAIDSSWKIRRDAVRCFVAIASALVQYPESFVASCQVIFSALLKRINDRDEGVRLEAIAGVSSVVRSCSRITANFCNMMSKSVVDALNTLASSVLVFSSKVSRKLLKLFNDANTSVKVRTCCVQLAATLLRFDEGLGKKVECECNKANQEKFTNGMLKIWNVVDDSLKSSESSSAGSITTSIPTDPAAATLKVESLLFLQALLCAPVSTRVQAVACAATVSKCVAETYVRCACEALRVVPCIISVIHKAASAEDAPVVNGLAVTVVDKFTAIGISNLDLEVKEAALAALSSIVSLCGALINPDVFKSKCLHVVSAALEEPATRSTAIKLLTDFSSTSVKLDISSIAVPALVILSKHVTESGKQLRLSALTAIAALMKHEIGAKTFSDAQVVALLDEVYRLISDKDLYLSHLAINVVANAIASCDTPAVKDCFSKHFAQPIDTLMKTQALQGAALSSVRLCFNICAKSGVFPSPPKNVAHFVQIVTSKSDISKQVIISIANVCAAYIEGIPSVKDKQDSVMQLVDAVKKPFTKENQASQSFGMYALGFIGSELDLAGLMTVLFDEIAIPAFTKGSDEIRTSAKFMLGAIANGNVDAFIPALVAWSKKVGEGEQYYVLATLQEFASRLVATNNAASAQKVSESVIGVIKALIHDEDEGKRNVAWDCLGKLAALAPSVVCPVILAMVSDASKEFRTIAAASIRIMYSSVVGSKNSAQWQIDNCPAINVFIHDNAAALFNLLKDGEVQVRRQILLSTNYLLHQNSAVLIPDEVLKSIVAPSVLRETEIRPELIEEIRIGPHKDIQDYGLESRKAAYACLSSLLDAYPDVLGVEPVLAHVAKGLKDNYDIVLVAIQICSKIATSSFTSAALVSCVDKELSAVLDSLVMPVKDGQKKSADEMEHAEDIKKHTVRLIGVMKNIPGILSAAPAFGKLVNTRILPSPELSALMKEVEESLKSETAQKTGK